MRFKGKVDLWFWGVLILIEGMLVAGFLNSDGVNLILILVAIVCNLCFLPYVLRNYVEIDGDRLTVVFGFGKSSMNISEITEISRTRNPIASSAASLDRIVFRTHGSTIMCAVKDSDKLFDCIREKNPNLKFSKEPPKKGGLETFTSLFTLIVIIGAAFYLMTGNIHVEYGDTSFTIKASYWYDKEVAYDEVVQIEYRDEKVAGSRVAGFGSFRLLMGDFKNEQLGNYTRYTYANCDAGVILYLENEKELVLSGKDRESTRQIYENLLPYCGRVNKK